MTVLIVLISLIINIVFAVVFSSVAEEKGYFSKGYFWLCFFFGLIGYVYICALPNTNLEHKLNSVLGALADLRSSSDRPNTPETKTAAPVSSANSSAPLKQSGKRFDPESYPAGPV